MTWWASVCTALVLSWLDHVTTRNYDVTKDDVSEQRHISPEAFLLPGGVDEVLHGEHAQDLLMSRDGVTSRDTLLFLYAPSCQGDVNKLVTPLLRHSLPGESSLALMRHDYESTHDWIWFDDTHSGHDLHRMYALPSNTCSCFVFVPIGAVTLFDAECQPLPSSAQKLVALTWKSVTFQLVVLNRYNHPVKVSFSGKGPRIQDLFLPAGSSTAVWAYPSYTAHAHTLENDDFLNGWYIVNKSMKMLEITRTKRQLSAQLWEVEHGLKVDDVVEQMYKLRWSHAQRHLAILLQPFHVSNFTELGFAKKRIPQDVFRQLLNIYNSESGNLRSEYYPSYFTAWNLDEVNIEQITLPAELSALLAEELRPMMEEFCRCTLRQTVGEGIATRLRRYPTGARVRMHVDELESGHVIGSILHLARDLAGQQDWPLEVIDFGGRPQTIETSPGDMVIFESSRLPHGRSAVFTGKYYVNTFFYYKPVDRWENGQFINDEQNGDDPSEGGEKALTSKGEL